MKTMVAEKRWTQTDVTALRTRLDVGESPLEIAQALDRSAENVAGMMARLFLRARDLEPRLSDFRPQAGR